MSCWGSRSLPFPHNITAGQRECIEAVGKHGSLDAAAQAMGLSRHTMNNQLTRARLRVGVHTTRELVERLAALSDRAPARISQPEGDRHDLLQSQL